MTTQEAVWAATAGGARALRRDDVGHLRPGARADLVLLDAPSHAYLAYRPGVPLVAAVWQDGDGVMGGEKVAGQGEVTGDAVAAGRDQRDEHGRGGEGEGHG